MPDKASQLRGRRRRGRRRYTGKAPIPAQAQQAPAAPSAQHMVHTPSSVAPEATPDYSYVVRDLKRIGIIMGGMVVVLIVLSFFW